MGITFEINSIEEMCDLMCDNEIPEGEQTWIFTFGSGQQHAGHYVKIDGTYDSARREMFDRYGKDWSFQYSEEEWEKLVENAPPWVKMETELK